MEFRPDTPRVRTYPRTSDRARSHPWGKEGPTVHPKTREGTPRGVQTSNPSDPDRHPSLLFPEGSRPTSRVRLGYRGRDQGDVGVMTLLLDVYYSLDGLFLVGLVDEVLFRYKFHGLRGPFTHCRSVGVRVDRGRPSKRTRALSSLPSAVRVGTVHGTSGQSKRDVPEDRKTKDPLVGGGKRPETLKLRNPPLPGGTIDPTHRSR